MKKVRVIMNNGRSKAVDKRSARILVELKKAVYAEDYKKKVITSEETLNKSIKVPEQDELSKAREEYYEAIGKRPYHGWDVEELRSKIESS